MKKTKLKKFKDTSKLELYILNTEIAERNSYILTLKDSYNNENLYT